MKGHDMNASERNQLIDKGFELDQQIKNMTAELKKIKSALVKEARSKKGDKIRFNGGKHAVEVWKKETRVVLPFTLHNALKSKKQGKHFHDCVKVDLGAAGKLFSSDELDDLADDWKISRCVSFKK
jgi:hypothetical protein